MNFSVIYKNMAIDHLTATTVAEAKRYVQRRYINQGAGCSLSYVDNKTGKQTETSVGRK